MKQKKLLESLGERVGDRVEVRRYNLSDMISESYKVFYNCDSNSSLRSLVESHLEDVRRNPKDIDRLSRQLSIVKEVVRMHESGEISDKDLEIATKSKVEGPIKEDTRGLGKYQILDKEGKVVDEFTSKKDAEDRVSVLYKSNHFKNGELKVVDNRNNESCSHCKGEKVEKEDDLLEDTNLTEEEVDALTKHLSEIRKARRTKENCKESTTKGRKLRRTKENCKESNTYKKGFKKGEFSWDVLKGDRVVIYDNKGNIQAEFGSEEAAIDAGYQLEGAIDEARDFDMNDPLWAVVKDDGTYAGIPCTSEEEAYQLSANHENSVVFKLLAVTDENCSFQESNSYESVNLSGFSKKSKDKAFMRTFKKLSDKLHEGTTLTRQESISLYKAANSAMTQLSVELEHNPEFLDSFKESVNILSGDVNCLLESMKKGKAPKESTMKSLAKFYDALNESDAMDREREKYMKDREAFIKKARTSQNAPNDAIYDDNTGVFRDKSGKVWNPETKKYDTDLKEAEEEDEELDNIEDEELDGEEEFVGDDEGDIVSEEGEEFDREYADARVELHKDLVDKHSDDEDPVIQDKLSQDAEEVADLPGITDEQLEELEGEVPEEEEEIDPGDTEDEEDIDEIAPLTAAAATAGIGMISKVKHAEIGRNGLAVDFRESEDTEIETDDGDDITDDELEQLKKYLKEMRQSKKKSK